MIFSIMSWSMCIESRAAFGDVSTITGDDVSSSVVFNLPVNPSIWATSKKDSKTAALSRLSSFAFEQGRQYEITIGSVTSSYTHGGSNYSSPYLLFTPVSIVSPDSSQTWTVGQSGGTFTYDCKGKGNFVLNYTVQYGFAPVDVDRVSGCTFNYSATFSGYTIKDITPRTEKEILEDIEKIDKEQLEQQKEQTETQKGIFGSIKDFFGSFFQNLIDSVIGLFVPSSDEMSDLFGQLNDFFSDTFGFLYAPFDYLIQLIGVFTSSTGTTGLTLPGFSIMGHEVWGDQTYDISSDPVAGQVLGYVRIGTGVLLAGWFIMYLQDFFKERFGKG